MKIINLTSHEVVVLCEDGTRKVFPPSGQVARVEIEDVCLGQIDGIPINKGKVKEIAGIPEAQDGTMYIVSLFVLQNSDRKDLIAPDTNSAVRDDKGRITAVRGWRK